MQRAVSDRMWCVCLLVLLVLLVDFAEAVDPGSPECADELGVVATDEQGLEYHCPEAKAHCGNAQLAAKCRLTCGMCSSSSSGGSSGDADALAMAEQQAARAVEAAVLELPPGWGKGVHEGKVFYYPVDAPERIQWDRPEVPLPTAAEVEAAAEQAEDVRKAEEAEAAAKARAEAEAEAARIAAAAEQAETAAKAAEKARAEAEAARIAAEAEAEAARIAAAAEQAEAAAKAAEEAEAARIAAAAAAEAEAAATKARAEAEAKAAAERAAASTADGQAVDGRGGCEANGCGEHGFCVAGACSCSDGYSGSACDKPPDPCFWPVKVQCVGSSRCEGGHCVRSESAAGDGGGCDELSCGKNGKCVSGACQCDDGWGGVACEDRDECYAKPCKNGGSCFESGDVISELGAAHAQLAEAWSGSYRCACAAGFIGKRCQCLDCGEHGLCRSDGKCQCKKGFAGSRCRKNIDECASNPCGEFGTCTDGVSSYTCNCKPGHKGFWCEQREELEVLLAACASSPCGYHGKCVDEHDTEAEEEPPQYSCKCGRGWSGEHCEEFTFRGSGSQYSREEL
jgi:hypothetical protein